MICKNVCFSEHHPLASLTIWLSEDAPLLQMPPRRAIVICPGGGYRGHAVREGEPIARKFYGEGFNVFQLHYSVGENATDDAPMIELALAIRHIRERAAEYHIDADQIFVIGFSAGGHLAASSGVLWNHPRLRDAVGVTSGDAPEGINRPTGTILCYPVITSGQYTHRGSFDRLCGSPEASEQERARFSLEHFVDKQSVPSFIWHTVTDSTVSVQNSVLFMQALIAHDVPVEAHFYPKGRHGLALASTETWSGQPERLVPHVQSWFTLALRWIQDFHTIAPHEPSSAPAITMKNECNA